MRLNSIVKNMENRGTVSTIRLFTFICIVTFCPSTWGIDKIASDLSLVTKGELLDLIKKNLKDESDASYKEAIRYLKEVESRGAGYKDWEEYRVKQALARCYYSIGEPSSSYKYWTDISSLDTTKYFGDRPKHLIVGSDVLYNRVVIYQAATFGSSNKSSSDSLAQFAALIDSLRSIDPTYPENGNLLFNKAFFLSESGNSKEAEDAIAQIRKGYPKFSYMGRLDSLDCKNNRIRCNQAKK